MTHTAEQPETIPAVDAVTVALVAAFVSLAVGGLTASVTAWSAHKTSKTAREGRIDQRRADAYVHVLTIVEREGHWCEAWVANFGHYKGYSHEDQYEFDEFVRPPEPEVTDRATTAALLAAIGSSTVRDCHAAWRAAADVLTREVRLIHHGLSLDPMYGVAEEYLKPIRDEVLPREQAARRALAEAIAQELGHRKRHRRRTELRQMERE